MDPAPADRPVPAPAPATPPRPPAPSTAAPTAPPSAAPPAVRVLVHRLDPGLPLPSASHPDDAGTDLHAARDVHLAPGERTLVGTGIALALPSGYAGFVHPRSGLAARHGVTIVNAPGTVDAGYRGEVMVSLLNTDRAHAVDLPRGSRIAQLVVQRVERVELVEVTGVHELPASERGARGHGSTGTSGVRASGAGDRADSGVGPQRRPGAAPDAEAGGDAEAADGAARDDSGGRAERPAPAEETTW